MLGEIDSDHTQLKLNPYTLPTTVSSALYGGLAHEFAHNFAILDEYGGAPCLPSKSEEGDEDTVTNIQVRSSLLRDAGGLDPDRIHWLWHRIKKAGILLEDPNPQQGTDPVQFKFRIFQDTDTFKIGNKDRDSFELGNIVRLRSRVLTSPQSHAISKRLKIINITGGTYEKEVTVKFTEPEPDASKYPTWFPKDSIIFIPAQGPDGSELLLVPPAILEHMRKTHGPLNAPKNNEMRPCNPYAKKLEQIYPRIQVATSLPDDVKLPKKNRPRYRSWYVGIYEQGGGYDCNVYHPTGACLMRGRLVEDQKGRPIREDERGRPISIYNFCPVCKYILVNKFDATKHGEIDKRYEKRYPL